MKSLVFILEDEDSDARNLENRFRAIGFDPRTFRNLWVAKVVFNGQGDAYAAYFLDMRVPEEHLSEPIDGAGLDMREYLMWYKVDSDKIITNILETIDSS